MTLRNLVLVAALATLLPAAASAQQPRVRPSASVLFRPAPVAAASDTLHLPRTYWKEGALIVGIPSALFGGAVGVGLCGLNESGNDSSCVGAPIGMAIFFGALGAITGALIGGQFNKQ